MDSEKKGKVIVGMSGGVDSTYAAYSLAMDNYQVTGLTMRFFSGMGTHQEEKDDLAEENARLVCERLNIRHIAVDVTEEFREEVVDYLVAGYGSGDTPNPCIACNRRIKFPLLARAADREGARWIATGHYARVERFKGKPVIARARDRKKDQSYFLYRVSPEILERVIFPLGEVVKDKIKSLLEGLNIPVIRRESQDICFIADGELEDFLAPRLEPQSGEVLSTGGQRLGSHRGSCFYTIGQRKGLGISASRPLYVVRKDTGRNIVFLGEDRELLTPAAICRKIIVNGDLLDLPLKCRIRYRHNPVPVEALSVSGDRMKVMFSSPQRAVTPGQSLVLYRGDMVAGGGIISGEQE